MRSRRLLAADPEDVAGEADAAADGDDLGFDESGEVGDLQAEGVSGGREDGVGELVALLRGGGDIGGGQIGRVGVGVQR